MTYQMTYKILDPADVRDLIASAEPLHVVDVRTVEEYDAGHIAGSINVPILFHGGLGVEWNERFLDAMGRLFEPEERLVFV